MTITELVRDEVVAGEPAVALARLLGVPEPDPTSLPPLWHWLYLLERPAQSDLGADGHPAHGVIPAPPGPGRRRMWAGGRVLHYRGLHVGVPARRHTSVLTRRTTQGRSGPLEFVTVRHVLTQGDTTLIEEEQDIVYRDASVGAPAPPAAGREPAAAEPLQDDRIGWVLPIDPTFLFRFSALTYNAHRIHYDRDYAVRTEGYAGLVTHGPLQALSMVDLVRRRAGHEGPLEVDYRLVAPLLDGQGMVVRANPEGGDVWRASVSDLSGRETATANVALANEEGA